MTKEDIYLKIKSILSEKFEIDEALIIPEADLYKTLELDSIDAVDLIVNMKGHISGKIEPELFKKVVTVQDVVDVLYPLINQET